MKIVQRCDFYNDYKPETDETIWELYLNVNLFFLKSEKEMISIVNKHTNGLT